MATFKCCDCGGVFPIQTSGGTGYAYRTQDQSIPEEARRMCYPCAAIDERERMIRDGYATLYLVKREGRIWVQNWTGHLEFLSCAKVSRHGGGFGTQRTDAWFTGPDGLLWHAVNRGDMQIARCRRLKRQP